MEEEEEDDRAIKIILLGESGVGKTNLIRVAMGNPFERSNHSTITSSYYDSEIIINNKQYSYCLWDTAGQESYRSLNQMFVKDSKIVLVVCAINNKKSFQEIDFWVNYTKETLGNDKYILSLVANKSDLYNEQEVPDEEVEKKAKELNIKFKITSAAEDAVGFRDFLNKLIEEYINTIYPTELKKPKTFKIEEEKKDDKNVEEKKKKKNCC
jgi:small GTP-binding protein